MHPIIRPVAPVLVWLLLAFAAQSQTDSAAFQRVLDEAIADPKLVGLSAAVSIGGMTAWSGGAGWADIENRVPETGHSVHRLASVSKSITAMAVMKLVEQKKLALEQTVRDFISDYPQEKPITILHLLTHTSGIRHYVKPNEADGMEHYRFLRLALPIFENDPLLFEPGTKYHYTTYGYTLLGEIAQRAGGYREFGDLMRELIWAPAGMNDTRLELVGEIVPHRVRGYSIYADREIRNAPYTDLSYKYPGGGMLTTVEDMMRLVQAFDAGKLVSLDARGTMLTLPVLPGGEKTIYALGWRVGTNDHGFIYTHSGGQAGTTTYLACYPDAGVAVAVFSNVDGTGEQVDAVTGKLLGIAFATAKK
ncbi:MAG: serine hydrolase domain-containing protein [Candidatus Hydrogenedentota bacterium]